MRKGINGLIQVSSDSKLPEKLIIIIRIKTNSNNNNHSKVKLVIKPCDKLLGLLFWLVVGAPGCLGGRGADRAGPAPPLRLRPREAVGLEKVAQQLAASQAACLVLPQGGC